MLSAAPFLHVDETDEGLGSNPVAFPSQKQSFRTQPTHPDLPAGHWCPDTDGVSITRGEVGREFGVQIEGAPPVPTVILCGSGGGTEFAVNSHRPRDGRSAHPGGNPH